MLIGASLFLESFQTPNARARIRTLDVLLVGMDLSQAGYSTEPGKLFMRQLRDRVQALPGGAAVSFGTRCSASRRQFGLSTGRWYLPRDGEDMKGLWAQVWPGYFDLMRIGLLKAGHLTIVTIAKRCPWSSSTRLSRSDFSETRTGWAQAAAWRGATHGDCGRQGHQVPQPIQSPLPYLNLPIQQAWEPQIRASVCSCEERVCQSSKCPRCSAELRFVDPSVNLDVVFALSDFISASWFVQKVAASLLGGVGRSGTPARRAGPFQRNGPHRDSAHPGNRHSHGPRRPGDDAFGPVLGQALRLTMVGVGIGLALSFALTRLVASQLLGASATDPLTFVGVSCLLCAVALAASYLPVDEQLELIHWSRCERSRRLTSSAVRCYARFSVVCFLQKIAPSAPLVEHGPPFASRTLSLSVARLRRARGIDRDRDVGHLHEACPVPNPCAA